MIANPNIFILFSLGVDLFLCGVLGFLWYQHKDEKHALGWALGQFGMAAFTAILFLGTRSPLHYACAALMATLSVAGFWAGTQAFLGQLTELQVRRAALWFAAAGTVMFGVGMVFPASVGDITAYAYGLTFLWAGCRLVPQGQHIRVLGCVFLLRGAFNFANGLGLIPVVFEGWIIFSFLIKGVSMLCLIHAVQDKIQKRYTRAIDSLSKGFVVLDSDGKIRDANERYAQGLGSANVPQLVGTHVAEWLPGITRDMVRAHFQRFAASDSYPYVETTVLSIAEDRDMPVELIASPLHEHGQLFCMMLVMDITERKKKDDELYRTAHYDSTTGVHNRHGLSRELQRLLLKAAHDGQQCAVLFIDIDKFKRVNDSFGHAVGDQLLQQLAQRLQQSLRPEDVLGRVGADEFVVVLPGLPVGEATSMAAAFGKHLLRSLAGSFDLAPHAITVSASIGVACYPEDGVDGDTLVRHADIAMHDVKKSGRGDLHFFSANMSAYAREALVIDGALRSAIANQELRLVYQPIVDAGSGQMDKVEALLRWHSATLGHVGPDRFIPVAEDSDLIIELGAWVLAEACRQLAAWRTSLPMLTMSINVSARQLLDPAFLGMVKHALAVNDLSARQLELELTERVLIGDVAQVSCVLGGLRELGVGISLDDFGTGYSSLSYLTQFQINTLKIDRSFVTDMVASARSKALVATIIAMGHTLGIKLVAEGVETAEQAHALEQMGCHYLQGYHISRPVSGHDLLQLATA